MSSNRVATILTIAALSVPAQVSHAGENSSVYQCPAHIDLQEQTHRLAGASVFDTFPSLRDLVPDFIGKVQRWTIDKSIDPFLVCRYQDVKHLFVIHAKGAKSCEIGLDPISAKCFSGSGAP